MPQFRPQQYLLLHLTKATNTQKQMLKHIRDKMHVFLNSLKIGCQTLPCLYLMYEQLFHGGKVFENNLLAIEW